LNKRALLLSAAAAALLSAPALAATTLTKVETTEQKTSATGDLTINSGAGISFKSATTPLLLIDSSNTVNNGGALTSADQDKATAVIIQANGFTGSFTSNGSIGLTGTGSGKTGIYLQGLSSFTGNVTLDTNSTVTIVGPSSNGLQSDPGTVLNGDWLLAGTFAMNPGTSTSSSSSTSTAITIANLLGTTNGNVVISAASSYSAIGNGTQGFVLSGALNACNTVAVPSCTEIGTFSNSGVIAVAGVATRDPKGNNPESGSAVIIENSLAGGFLNNGPVNTADTTGAASISGNGVVPVVLVGSTVTTSVHLGAVTSDATNGTFGFINRGTIAASPLDPNKSAITLRFSGAAATPVTVDGGLFSSGIISTTATTVTPGSAVSTTAIEIDDFVTIPKIVVSSQATASGSSMGTVSSTVTGPQGGQAVAILIGGVTAGAASGTSVPEIDIQAGARVVASANASEPANTTISTLAAVAIQDVTNSLTVINNAGTISAIAKLTDSATNTPILLTGGGTPVAHAVNASLNSVGLTFNNSGTVIGDVLFGAGSDTYTVQGTGPAAVATHTGAINFGFSIGGSNTDTLHVGQFANVAGAITAQGTLDVKVDGTGSLTVQNIVTTPGTALTAHNFDVAGGTPTSAGTVNVTVSQNAGAVPIISASNEVTFGGGANLGIQYGSFITTGGNFTLISAPTGFLGIGASDVARYNAQVSGGAGSTLPFLFQSASVQKVNDGAGHDILQLTIVPKTATQLGLTGYAKAIFPFANTAVATDDALGAAMVTGINSQADAQKAYDAYAPNLSGGARAIAVSLTDQSTGVVAARIRQLRLFTKEPGDLTLWGNEFGQYISNQGGNVPDPPGVINSGPASGFKDHGFGFSLGLDTGSPEGGWYGAAFSFYTGDINENGDRDAKTNSLWYMFTGYSDWRGRGLFLDSELNVGLVDFKGKRFINLLNPATNSTFTREADNKHSGLMGSFGVTAGALLNYSGVFVIPQISLDGMSMREEGYTEVNGGSGFNLTVKPTYANSMRIFLGSEFRGDVNMGDFFLQPAARIGYRYDFLNDPTKLHVQFADLQPAVTGNQPGPSFTMQGPDPSQGNIVAGAGLNATTENWTIGLSYDFVRGSHNATEQVGTLSLLGRI
jgi:hypothetical protein